VDISGDISGDLLPATYAACISSIPFSSYLLSANCLTKHSGAVPSCIFFFKLANIPSRLYSVVVEIAGLRVSTIASILGIWREGG